MTGQPTLDPEANLFRRMAENTGRWALDFIAARRGQPAELRAQFPNLLAALSSSALFGQDWPLVIDLAISLNDPIQRAGLWRDWQPHLERLLELTRQRPGRPGEFRLLLAIGDALALQGDHQPALAWLDAAAGLVRQRLRQPGGSQELAATEPEWFRPFTRLAECFIITGDLPKAIACLEEARLAASYPPGDEYALLIISGQLGRLYTPPGEWAAAERLFTGALQIARQRQDTAQMLSNLNHLVYVYRCLGQYVASDACGQEALAICRQLGERSGEGMVLLNLGNLALTQGDLAAARPLLEQALAIQRQLDHPAKQSQALLALADMWLRQSHLARLQEDLPLSQEDLSLAQAYLDEAASLLGKQPNAYLQGLRYWRSGDLAQARGDLQAAQSAWQRSRDWFNRGGETYWAGQVGKPIDPI